MYFSKPPQSAMLTILSILLATLPLSLSEPHCMNPPSPPSKVPTLGDCDDLVLEILATSEAEHHAEILWASHPSATLRNHKLPYVFKNVVESKDCAFVVDAVRGDVQDTFPTWIVAEAALAIVEKCLVQGIDGAKTLGGAFVGPKSVIAVTMVKKKGRDASEALVDVDITNVTLSKPGSPPGPLSSMIEEG